MSKDVDFQNSRVEVYLETTARLVGANPLGISTSKNIRRDIETLRSRTRDEGLSFLTKALPTLGKALDKGLIDSRFTLPRGWKHQHGCRSRPAFLQEYFNLVFDVDGALRDDADPAAVFHLRQIAFAMYKLEVPYQRREEEVVIDSFIATDSALELDCNDPETADLVSAASYIARDVFRSFDPRDILPRHGPGAVATGERLDDKWRFSRLYHGIHQVYPYYEYFVVGWAREISDRTDWYRSLQRCESGTAKVVLVPKDSRGPRLISCEPLEYQWIQQGIGRKMVSHLESFWMTRGQINFTHQEINRSLAMSSSLTGEMATLDLKDASDRVSLDLVRQVFAHNPDLLKALEASRTTATKLPDGRTIELRKFAPMGSALCFPVEAFIFWAVIVAGIVRSINDRPTHELLQLVGKRVYVYGDDIIVPTEWAHVSMQALERVGLMVNRSKSCVTGNFRESCGMDAFKGVQVTPLRLKTLWSGQPSDGSAYTSYIAFANNIRERGYEDVYLYIKGLVESVYGVIPHGTTFAGYPCWIVADPFEAEEYNSKAFKSRVSGDYQRKEFLLKRVIPGKQATKLDGWQRLLRNVVSDELTDPSTIVVPRSIKIKRGWMAVY